MTLDQLLLSESDVRVPTGDRRHLVETYHQTPARLVLGYNRRHSRHFDGPKLLLQIVRLLRG